MNVTSDSMLETIRMMLNNGSMLRPNEVWWLLEQLTAAQRERDQARSHAKDCESCDTSYCEMANRARKAEAQLKEAREKLRRDVGKIICAIDDNNPSLAKHLLIGAMGGSAIGQAEAGEAKP